MNEKARLTRMIGMKTPYRIFRSKSLSAPRSPQEKAPHDPQEDAEPVGDPQAGEVVLEVLRAELGLERRIPEAARDRAKPVVSRAGHPDDRPTGFPTIQGAPLLLAKSWHFSGSNTVGRKAPS